MGSYHSYVGDIKLEDSKDNWYRISGLNISRWNITTWANVSRSLWSYSGSDGGFVLAKAGRGLAGKSQWSDLLYKALKQDDALTLPRGVSTPSGVTDGFIRFIWTSGDNNMDSLDIAGNSFDFKNRLTKTEGVADSLMLNCTTATGGLYGKAASMFFSIYNIESTLHGNNYYFRDTPIEPDRNGCCFRPMLTLKPVGDPEGTVLYCEVTAKLVTQPYGYDRTIKFKPIYSKYNITKVELVLNIDENGNYDTKGSTGTFGADVLAGIVPPKNDETICIEFKTVNQKASGNAYTLKISFNNGKVLYLQDALIRTGNSVTDVTNVRYDIYRENRLK